MVIIVNIYIHEDENYQAWLQEQAEILEEESNDPSFLNEYSSPLFDSGIGLIILSALIFHFLFQ